MKRSIAVIVAGFVTTLTVMGGTFVAAQTGAFASVTTLVQTNSDINVARYDPQPSNLLTDTNVIEYYTQTQTLDWTVPANVNAYAHANENARNVSTAQFRTRLYDIYEKLKSMGGNQGVGISRWFVSDTITSTLHDHDLDDDHFHGISGTISGTHEIDFDFDNDHHGISGTLTETHHIKIDDESHGLTVTLGEHGNRGEHGLDLHSGDDHHAITTTVVLRNHDEKNSNRDNGNNNRDNGNNNRDNGNNNRDNGNNNRDNSHAETNPNNDGHSNGDSRIDD